MRPFTFYLFLSLLLLPQEYAQAIDVSLVGDSLMESLSPFLSSGLTSQGHTVHSVARRGWSTHSFRLAGSYLARSTRHSDLVIVVLGTNDCTTNRSMYVSDIRWLLSQFHSARVIWLGPPSSTHPDIDARQRRTASLQRILMPESVDWVDSRVYTDSLPNTHDGIHFTRSSYRSWSTAILEHLRPYTQEN